MSVWGDGFEQGLSYIFKNGLVAGTAGFKDIEKHWAKADIEALAAQAIVAGRGEGRFAPEADITRAEFVSLLVRAFDLTADAADADPFFDVPKNAWYADAIAAAMKAGIAQGNGDGKFWPDKPITREEMAVFASRALEAGGSVPEKPEPGSAASFNDEAQISAWALPAVKQTTELGLLQGYPDGAFGPGIQATRAHAAVILNRLLGIVE